MSVPWKKDFWEVSLYNFVPEVTCPRHHVDIHDVTLREGEETAGVVIGTEEKVKIAQALDDLGIPRFEMWAGWPDPQFPWIPPEDLEALKAVVALRLNAKVFAGCSVILKKKSIDLALKHDVDHVILHVDYGHPLTLLKQREFMEPKPGKSTEELRRWVLETVPELISYAKDHGLYVMFHTGNPVMADWNIISQLYKVAAEAHPDSIDIADSKGVCLPEATAYFVKKVKEIVSIPVEVHLHNTWGLATANALAAYRAGAEVIHVGVNGIGGAGRGMAPLEEVVMNLLIFYGVDLGLKYEKLYEVSKLIERLSKIPIGGNKPIVGDKFFTYEQGEPFVEKQFGAEESIHPEFIGRKPRLFLGKHSNSAAIEVKLKEHKKEASPEEVKIIQKKVKDLSFEKKRAMTDKEFEKILKEVIR